MRERPPQIKAGDRAMYLAGGRPRAEAKPGVVKQVRYIIKDAFYRACFRPDGAPRDAWVRAINLRKIEHEEKANA